MIEQRIPRRAVIPGPEQTAGCGSDVELVRPARDHGEVGYPARHHRRSDRAERQVVHDRERLRAVRDLAAAGCRRLSARGQGGERG